nr:transglutaminase-like domain-containing protein [Ruminiclostridium sp.]
MNNDIRIEARVTNTFNFAMQQNYIPLIRSITLINSGPAPVENITVRADFEPGFAKPYTYELGTADAGRSTEISPVRLTLSTELLFSLTEKTAGNIHISAFSGDEQLAETDIPVDILAYDEWSGALIMPELIASFTSPNHPRVSEVVSRASVYLQKWTGSPSFTGYQSEDPNVAKQQAAAIYAALQEENIAYTVPPASFEQSGQRVRLPYTVLSEKRGTCLDLTLLFASCLEQVGLNPLVILVRGHCFAGFWLEDETFSDCAE